LAGQVMPSTRTPGSASGRVAAAREELVRGVPSHCPSPSRRGRPETSPPSSSVEAVNTVGEQPWPARWPPYRSSASAQKLWRCCSGRVSCCHPWTRPGRAGSGCRPILTDDPLVPAARASAGPTSPEGRRGTAELDRGADHRTRREGGAAHRRGLPPPPPDNRIGTGKPAASRGVGRTPAARRVGLRTVFYRVVGRRSFYTRAESPRAPRWRVLPEAEAGHSRRPGGVAGAPLPPSKAIEPGWTRLLRSQSRGATRAASPRFRARVSGSAKGAAGTEAGPRASAPPGAGLVVGAAPGSLRRTATEVLQRDSNSRCTRGRGGSPSSAPFPAPF